MDNSGGLRPFESSSFVPPRPRAYRLALAAMARGRARCHHRGSAFLSNRQLRIWHDSLSLWTHVQGHGGERSPVVQIHLALAPCRKGRIDEAFALLSRSVQLDPNKATPRITWGGSSWRRGESPRRSRGSRPRFAFSPNIRKRETIWGVALALQGKHHEAVAQYSEAVRLFPDYFDAHRNLAVSLLRLGQIRRRG